MVYERIDRGGYAQRISIIHTASDGEVREVAQVGERGDDIGLEYAWGCEGEVEDTITAGEQRDEIGSCCSWAE